VLKIRHMTEADVALGMRLTEQAGWNQTPADWQRVLALQPDGCFVAEADGVPVGTTVVCVFGSVAWVAQVLVDAAHRNRGIGTALMRHALAYTDVFNVPTVRLDATPLGEPIYRKLGFEPDYTMLRLGGTVSSSLAASAPLPECPFGAPSPLRGILDVDEAVTGTDRALLLLRLLKEFNGAVRFIEEEDMSAGAVCVLRSPSFPEMMGFLMSRPGRVATQIGPCIASPDIGGVLFADAWQRYAGQRVFVDIPESNEPALACARTAGLEVQRTLLRMTRGPRVPERVDWLWAGFGPEKG
jgi:GNAT superfamily N-acetyltransferase